MSSSVPDIFAAVAGVSERKGLPVLVIGGHAVNSYGYTRTTLDADFLICDEDLAAWRQALEEFGYQWKGQTDTFVHFEPVDARPDALPADLMLVNRETFSRLNKDRQEALFGSSQLAAPHPLHLIALKLHAMKNGDRRRTGKDLVDIVQLIRLCEIDTTSVGFQQIVEKYANQPTRALLDASLQAD